ncbi:HD domain-containing protein [Amycolatopsis kentuckyensis]|uniref:HD domain-containing protein n=1 Tax=Amycolatopsis kentuckyensis TaxID=218823 RepID=UPI000A3CCB58|nr:ATP-binding protein [Amycolatopsis kentuckyensis]
MSDLLRTAAEKRADAASHLPAFSGFSLERLRSELTEALTHFGRLGIFEEYTKHDISHVDGMLRLFDWLIPNDTAKIMSPADWLLSTLSAYLHDCGMLVTRKEFDRREETNYRAHETRVRRAMSSNRDLNVYLESLTEIEQEKFFYQEFVRFNHAKRINTWVSGVPDSDLGYDPDFVSRIAELISPLDPTFRSDLGLVCESHHLDDIDNINKYPVDKPYGDSLDETANVQYAALLLRAADLLHIARQRTPTVAYEIINPANPISQLEWSKQNAVRTVRSQKGVDAEGNVDPNAPRDTVEVYALFSNAEGFFGLTSYLQYASRELNECYRWAKFSNQRWGSAHQFPWRRIDSSNVEAHGFIAAQFGFKINEDKILDLLTGHTLYNNSNVVLRELVQNGIDAVRLMQEETDKDNYSPTVEIEWNSIEKVLSVTDNGTGMTQEVIESNFLSVGSSRYQEAQFQKEHPNFTPISRFGIGVLSAFMIADDIDVYTVSTEEEKSRHITLRSIHGKYLIELLEKNSEVLPKRIRQHGTHIRLQLRQDAHLQDVAKTLKHWIAIPRCRVAVSIDGSAPIAVGFESVADALKSSMLDAQAVKHDDNTQIVNRLNKPVKIEQFDHDGVTTAIALEWNDWFSQWSLMSIGRSTMLARTVQLGTCVEGIRVTTHTPGYIGTPFWALSNATGSSAPRTNVARTSLEHTSKYESYLRSVYMTYVSHVNTELEQMISDRKCSATKASKEANFLCKPIYYGNANNSQGEKAVESERLVLEALSEVSSYAIEDNGRREVVSLRDLQRFEYLHFFENSLARNLEYVLSAIPVNKSISEILSALDSDDKLVESPGPRYCSPTGSLLFTNLFARYWGPAEISIDAAQRSTFSKWVHSSKDRWWHSDADLDLSSFRDNFDVHVPASDAIQLSGTGDYTGIRLLGRTYLFPNNPLVRLVVTDKPYIETDEQSAMIFELIKRMVEVRRRGSQSVEFEIEKKIFGELRANGFGDGLSPEELVGILTGWSHDIFNLDRWERHESPW